MTCETNCLDMRGIQCKHPDDAILVYADFGPFLQHTSKTIASVTVSCADDPTLTLGTPTVIGSSTPVPWINEEYQVVAGTIAANKGVQVLVSDGTAQATTEDPLRILFQVTLSSGEIVTRFGLLRVEG